jgi:hypothetical protein
MYSNTTPVSNKPLTKYQLFVLEQKQRAIENTKEDANEDPIESLIRGFAKI